ncbi:phosphoenolpyruvate--protein phosphotransferase [Corynebacterium epidermidicanis]|uniref:Phosphoenolpyruvate-protein phosphotransferase n=1 Tax=Corynebacterium epidermidicanis TaxID=1050174 RepID=A0A0G3GQA4_9CORY|nr:phosphoenolpyruvate--protein phosphotransferase [Corynebacterium epidermidicanis]AKK03329.1 phosphoenolpyruvate-protein phosphotransferase [Corynebacterium epidermidicanis]
MSENTSLTHNVLQGTGVVEGVIYADAVWHASAPERPQAPREIPEDLRPAELERFTNAVAAVAQRLDKLAASADADAQAILTATAAMARDKGLAKAVRKQINGGIDAEWAIDVAVESFIAQFEKAGGVFAGRVTDLNDIRSRILSELRGEAPPSPPRADTSHSGALVLLADDLAPADTLTLDLSTFAGLVTKGGGPTSHTAIVARQRGLPCVVAVGDGLRAIEAGTPLLVNATAGTITVGADPELAQAAADQFARQQEAAKMWRGPVSMTDGNSVALLANVHDPASARDAAQAPAEGIGLFRTEFALLSAEVEPSTAEQAASYREVFEAFAGKKVVIRTVDAGSDKPVKFLNQDPEENPALGVRGLRIERKHAGVIDRQLEAIKQASELAGRTPESVWVMAPMVDTVAEAQWFVSRARAHGFTAGIMIETPAVALMADAVLREVDFVSIGTNDLTQYTMAADRQISELGDLCDPWQPAVLRLIRMVCAAGETHNVPVGVCGESAADPYLACVLVGLGVKSLSMASPSIVQVGSRLDTHSVADYQAAAQAACAAPDAEAARAAVLELLT